MPYLAGLRLLYCLKPTPGPLGYTVPPSDSNSTRTQSSAQFPSLRLIEITIRSSYVLILTK